MPEPETPVQASDAPKEGAVQAEARYQTVGLIMVITFIGKVMGLIRDMLMGHNFATGAASNAFQTASQIPRNFFDAVFASAISASFIPIFNETLEKKGKEEAFRLSRSFFTLMGLLTLALSILGILFSSQLTGLLASGFDEETAALCSNLLKILFPTVFFTGLAFSMVGVLQSLGEFNIPAALSVFSNGVIILYFIFLCDRFGVYGLAVAYLIGWAMQAIVQFPSLHRLGFRYRFSLWHPGLKRVFTLMLSVMVSTWIHPINQMISTRFASYLDGGVSALTYANSLYTMLAGIVVLSMTNVIFPEMSRLTANEKTGELRELIRSSLQSLLFLLLPMTIGLMLLAKPMIQLLYQHGTWGEESTLITSQALVWLSVGMIGYGIQNVLVKAFYAEKNGKVPMITGAVSIVLNIALCCVLSPLMGIAGLALATALSSTASALLLLVPISKRLPGLFNRPFWRDIGKMILCTAVMGVLVWLVYSGLSGVLAYSTLTVAAELIASVLVGVAVYFLLAHLLHIPELKQVLSMFLRRRKKGN